MKEELLYMLFLCVTLFFWVIVQTDLQSGWIYLFNLNTAHK